MSDTNLFSQGIPHTQAAIEVATRLRDRTKLESVHVIPTGVLGFEGQETELGESEYGSPPFSERLGAIASDYVAYELAFSILMRIYELPKLSGPENKIFQIGIAAGSTVRSIINSFRLPEGFAEKIRNSEIKIQVCPLVIGPMPETASSAGFLASLFTKTLQQALHDKEKVKFMPLSEKIPQEDGYKLAMLEEVRRVRDADPSILSLDYKKIDDKDKKQDIAKLRKSQLRLDWILTGVGSNGKGQLKEHIELRYKDDPKLKKKIEEDAIGDICSRIYDKNGEELAKADGDKFVGISFEWLRFLANDRHKKHAQIENRTSGQHNYKITAVTGGDDKYDAIFALVQNTIEAQRHKSIDSKYLCPFNSLVTDEITARRLLRDIHKKYVFSKSE